MALWGRIRAQRTQGLPQPLQHPGQFPLTGLEFLQGIRERLQPARLHKRLSGKPHQAIQAIRRNPDHAIRCRRCWRRKRRGRIQRFLHYRRRRRSFDRGGSRRFRGQDRGHLARQALDLRRMLGQPALRVPFRGPGDLRKHIHAAQQNVHMVRTQRRPPLHRHKAIFHRVRQRHRRVYPHNARRPLDGVRRPHQRLHVSHGFRILLQRQQSLAQGRGMALHFPPKKLQHKGEIVKILCAVFRHRALLFSESNNRASSKYPTFLSDRWTIPTV